jgi:hypothetical protein
MLWSTNWNAVDSMSQKDGQIVSGIIEDVDNAWQAFILKHGRGSRTRDLATVLQRTEIGVKRIKQIGFGGAKTEARNAGLNFDELFVLWHGREPQESEWPLPSWLNGHCSYEWLQPEVSLLAALVGRLGKKEIAQVLTNRLRTITGDQSAERDTMAVQNQVSRLGLMLSDVIGGIPLSEAARQIGYYELLHRAKRSGELETFRVGRYDVIPYAAWEAFKAQKQLPPEGYVRLSTLRERLAIASDKLSEFARMGYVPGAVRVKPFGAGGIPSTQFGTWYIPPELAEQLLADRRAGRPMPWHGKPLLDNLKVTYKKWGVKRHTSHCAECAAIWGKAGPPDDFETYLQRYPQLDKASKRHLTANWHPGLTISEVANQAGVHMDRVQAAIDNEILPATDVQGQSFISRSDATKWIFKGNPNGENKKAWISVDTAMKLFCFSRQEIQQMIELDMAQSKLGMAGATRGIVYLLRADCQRIRETRHLSHEQAAEMVGIDLPHLREYLKRIRSDVADGSGAIPFSTVQQIIRRRQDSQRIVLTVEQAAAQLGVGNADVLDMIDQGVISPGRSFWDSQLEISAPMFKRLREELSKPTRTNRPEGDSVRLTAAAYLAGVSPTTVLRWADAGEVSNDLRPSGKFYAVESLKARARHYWRTTRLKRAARPAWLIAEAQQKRSAE